MCIRDREKNARDRAFGIACWTLGALAFVLLLRVGVSFSLTARTVVVEKVVELSLIHISVVFTGYDFTDDAQGLLDALGRGNVMGCLLYTSRCV